MFGCLKNITYLCNEQKKKRLFNEKKLKNVLAI